MANTRRTDPAALEGGRAINDYGEYSVAGIMREVKAAYGKEATP